MGNFELFSTANVGDGWHTQQIGLACLVLLSLADFDHCFGLVELFSTAHAAIGSCWMAWASLIPGA